MLKLIACVLMFVSIAIAEENKPKPCLLVTPTEGVQWAFGRVAVKYQYLDSVNYSSAQVIYKKSELEKIQKSGVHVVMVPRDTVRDQIKQARESCAN